MHQRDDDRQQDDRKAQQSREEPRPRHGDAHQSAHTGGVRRQEGPEPYDDRTEAPSRASGVEATGAPTRSGYEENVPGSKDDPARNRGGGRDPHHGQERALDDRSRWRKSDPDARSDRWSDDPGSEGSRDG